MKAFTLGVNDDCAARALGVAGKSYDARRLAGIWNTTSDAASLTCLSGALPEILLKGPLHTLSTQHYAIPHSIVESIEICRINGLGYLGLIEGRAINWGRRRRTARLGWIVVHGY